MLQGRLRAPLAAVAALWAGLSLAHAAETESAPAAAPASAPATTTFSLFYLMDIDGAFASFDCRGMADLRAGRTLDFANVVAALERERAAAAARGEAESLTIVGGDVLSPGPFAKTVLPAPGGPAALFEVLDRARVDHIALGTHELDVPPATLAGFLAAAEAHGLRTDAANVDCDPAKSGLCRFLGDDGGKLPRRWRVFERGGVRIGVVSLLDDTLPRRVTPDRVAGLTFAGPARAAREAIHLLRSTGLADVVVLVAHLEHASTTPRTVLELARALAGDDQPDLIVSNGLHSETGAGTVEAIHLSDGLPPIVGTVALAASAGLARFEVTLPPGGRGHGRARVRIAATGDVPMSPAVFATDLRARFVDQTERYCAASGTPIGAGVVAAPMDAAAFTTYTLEAMRVTTGAEIALLNAGTVPGGASFPFVGAISKDDLLRALPFESKVMVVSVKGAELERFLQLRWKLTRILGKHGLRIIGPETSDGKTFTINGRLLESDVPYRIASIDFVAKGGDDILEGFSGEAWLWSFHQIGGKPVVLRDLMARWLERRRPPGPGGAAPVLGAVEFRAPDHRVLVDARFDFQAGLTNVALRSTLTDAQAAVVPPLREAAIASLVSDFSLTLAVNNDEHSFDLYAGYSIALSTPDPLHERPTVNTDIITTDAVYKLTFFKTALGPDRWWVPEPYVGTFLETEAIPPRDASGRPIFPPARVLVASTGYRFTHHPKLESKLGAGLRWSGLGPTSNPPAVVAELGFDLKRIQLGDPDRRPIWLTADATLYAGPRYEGAATFLETEVRAFGLLEISLGWRLTFSVQETLYALVIHDPRRDALRDALGGGDPGPRTRLGLASFTLAALRIDLDARSLLR